MDVFTVILIIVNFVALILLFKSLLFSKPQVVIDNNNLSQYEIQRIIDDELKRRDNNV